MKQIIVIFGVLYLIDQQQQQRLRQPHQVQEQLQHQQLQRVGQRAGAPPL